MGELLLFPGALWSWIVILRHPANLLYWKPECVKGKGKQKEINRRWITPAEKKAHVTDVLKHGMSKSSKN